jgi:hypothetical protein
MRPVHLVRGRPTRFALTRSPSRRKASEVPPTHSSGHRESPAPLPHPCHHHGRGYSSLSVGSSTPWQSLRNAASGCLPKCRELPASWLRACPRRGRACGVVAGHARRRGDPVASVFLWLALFVARLRTRCRGVVRAGQRRMRRGAGFQPANRNSGQPGMGSPATRGEAGASSRE